MTGFKVVATLLLRSEAGKASEHNYMGTEGELWSGTSVSLGGKGLQKQLSQLTHPMAHEGKRGPGHY